MKTTLIFPAAAFLGQSAYGPKVIGQSRGVARQAVKPDVVSFSGKLVEITTGPCESTTGRSAVRTHLILKGVHP